MDAQLLQKVIEKVLANMGASARHAKAGKFTKRGLVITDDEKNPAPKNPDEVDSDSASPSPVNPTDARIAAEGSPEEEASESPEEAKSEGDDMTEEEMAMMMKK